MSCQPDHWTVAHAVSHCAVDEGLKLLLVDPDGPQQFEGIQRLAGVIYGVGTIADAWKIAVQQQPDLILLETSLVDVEGDQDGFKLCQQLQLMPKTRQIPILFLGRNTSQDDRLRAFEAGGVDFIQKPFCPEELLARIELHSRQAKTRRQIHQQTRKALLNRSDFPLLANLQKVLHQQTLNLHHKNKSLQREIYEWQRVEEALRKEQQKSEQLLLNILPEAIVTQLKQFQGSLAERFEEATVMFADIVDFTPLAAQRSPLELVNLLNQIFSAFDRLVEKYDLEKIKTIGDAYMVVGGVPVPHENHAVAIADMALEMQDCIRTFTREGDGPLQLRIGINTGTVVAGVIGIKKFSYDLWGDTVNIASRMESHGMPNKIQVAEATYDQLKDLFVFEPAQQTAIKGKGFMKTYSLLGRREAP